MSTKHVTVDNEIQAEVANRINYSSREVSRLLSVIEGYATRAQRNAADGMSISSDVQFLTSQATKLAEEQTKLDSCIQMAHIVGLSKDEIQEAFVADRVWFHTEESK